MPIYEYACRKCDARFEQLVRSMKPADGDRVKCPKCGSDQTARELSVFAVSSAAPSGGDAPMCGRCGGPPGSCSM